MARGRHSRLAQQVTSKTLRSPGKQLQQVSSQPLKASVLCVQVMKKKAKAGKGKGAGKTLTKTEAIASFFNFFSPPQEPEEDAEMEEEDIEELREALEADFELG